MILSDEQVAAIIRLSRSGARQIDIAVACGISRGHVAGIVRGLVRTKNEAGQLVYAEIETPQPRDGTPA